ncbi:ATPase, T2SS/T4P/T4SS family [Cupriavidus oxalaticus]|uniref:ATPase, T2SS/T4P/T4SS family n=1 Tax=Cupriavidus oxalaticus TaxID=96344 RepID=UPI003211ECF3
MRPGRYALRLSPKVVQNLGELKLGAEASQLLLDEDFRKGGLILVAGDTGSGKTTTAYATVKERLARYGGYCLTVESPVEKELEGFHGDGYCEQVDATNTGFKSEVASAMRKFPAETRSMFFFGEVLDEEAAAELARLIGRGHLVITTIHSATMEQAIEMLIALPSEAAKLTRAALSGKTCGLSSTKSWRINGRWCDACVSRRRSQTSSRIPRRI